MSRQAAPAFPAGTSKCAPSQRVPALTGTTASKNDRAGLFECPVCCGYALPPILHCQSGHLVCSNCCPKAHVVQPAGAVGIPSQLGPGGSGQFPCFPPRKYASPGGAIPLPHTQKADHEELREFRPYSCPCPGASCKWQGSLDAVKPLYDALAKSITALQGKNIVFLATLVLLTG
uniref:RING-type E3 ubiquitin transferase n=1 Tax=Felis catus TaxID=9685 RepID=A0ABI7YTH2_FELCA